MIDAVVFDMDGVIVDTEPFWMEEERAILDTALPSGHDVEPRDILGINVHDQYEKLAAEYDLEVTREEYFDLFDERADRVYERADPLPGLQDLLDEIGARGYPIGLCTSSYPRWIDIVFERYDLAERFDVVLSAATIDGPGKPEPDVYETVARRLDVKPTGMLVVEDSSNGMKAASSAGARTIGYVPEGRSTDTGPADYRVERPAELRQKILAILSS
ncbi:MAG: HAD family hydrolase [Halodesulfurarchaeum sp.]